MSRALLTLALVVAAAGCHDDTIKFSTGQRGLFSFAYGFDPIDSVAVAAGGARATLMVRGAPADAIVRSSDETILTFAPAEDAPSPYPSFFVYGGEPGRADAIVVDGAGIELDRITLEVARVEQLGVGITSLPVRVMEGGRVAFRVDLGGRKKLIGDPAISFSPSQILKTSITSTWPEVEAQAPGKERLVVAVDSASAEVPFEVVSRQAITQVELASRRDLQGTVILTARASDAIGTVWGGRCDWTFAPPEAALVKGTYVPSALNIENRASETTIVLSRQLKATCTIGGRVETIDVQP